MDGRIELSSNVSEQNLIEYLLNCKCSYGASYLPILSLYALINSWKFSKLMYYQNMLEEAE